MLRDPPRSLPGFWWGLAAIVLLAIALRAPLLSVGAGSYRLTEAFNTEEVENVRLSTGMLHKGTANPHGFDYPSLFYYLSAAVEAPVRALRGESWTADVLAVRSLSLVFGAAVVLLTGLLAARLGGPWAGLVASTCVAFDGTSIASSAWAKPNAAQVAFVLLGFLALVELAARPRLKPALAAAAAFALAAASKWFGGIGIVGLPVAAILGQPVEALPGLGRFQAALRSALRARLPALQLAAPFLVFALVFVICVPYSLLSPREFGYGLGQVFLSQSEHRRALSPAVSLRFLWESMGPLAAVLGAAALIWGLARLRRWDGSERANGLVLVVGWVLGYGAVLLFLFARLPSYVDLWVPFLAVLVGCAWAGEQGWVRATWARAAVLVAMAASGVVAHGADAVSVRRLAQRDTRLAAGRWLEERAAAGDTLLADQSVFVPDRFENVLWYWWGSPPRVLYDETLTWGHDPVWPDWPGGHRQLVFVNAKWQPPESLLARRPRWVITSSLWVDRRARPFGPHELASPGFDRALADGSAGYVERARFAPAPLAWAGWSGLRAVARAPAGALLTGPDLLIYERASPGVP